MNLEFFGFLIWKEPLEEVKVIHNASQEYLFQAEILDLSIQHLDWYDSTTTICSDNLVVEHKQGQKLMQP